MIKKERKRGGDLKDWICMGYGPETHKQRDVVSTYNTTIMT